MRKLIFLLAVSALGLAYGVLATNTSSASANSRPSNIFALPTPTPETNEELDFTLVNKTGYAIKQLYIGAAATADWTADDEVLKGRAFPNGASYDIKFHPKATAKKWDIKVEWADGSAPDEWLN